MMELNDFRKDAFEDCFWVFDDETAARSEKSEGKVDTFSRRKTRPQFAEESTAKGRKGKGKGGNRQGQRTVKKCHANADVC